MCQSNVVLLKSEYEKLLQERNSLRREVVVFRTRYITLTDSVKHILEVPKIIVVNNCEDFKQRILQLEDYNKGLKKNNISLVSTNTSKDRKLNIFRRRLKPKAYNTVGSAMLITYLVLRTTDDLFQIF